MSRGFKVKYDAYENVLYISKESSRKSVKVKDGKYGVQGCYNIAGNVVGLSIPEPDILFGISKKDLDFFFKEEL